MRVNVFKILFAIFLLCAPSILTAGNFPDILRECDSRFAKSGEFAIGACVWSAGAQNKYAFISTIEHDLSAIFPDVDMGAAFERVGLTDILEKFFEAFPPSGIIVFYVYSDSGNMELRIFDIGSLDCLCSISVAGISEGLRLPSNSSASISIERALKLLKSAAPHLKYADLSKYMDFSNKRSWSIFVRGENVFSRFSGNPNADGGGLELVQDAGTGRIFKMVLTR